MDYNALSPEAKKVADTIVKAVGPANKSAMSSNMYKYLINRFYTIVTEHTPKLSPKDRFAVGDWFESQYGVRL